MRYFVPLVKRKYNGPFTLAKHSIVAEWWVIRSAEGFHCASTGFSGNSKQRRQQRRAILRDLNS